MYKHKFDIKKGLKRVERLWKAGKLGNQIGKKDGEMRYSDGSVCAVGAMFNKRTLDAMAERGIYSSAEDVLYDKILDIPEKCRGVYQMDFLDLQRAHDEACGKSGKALKEKLWNFENVLEAKLKKYGVK